jgi:hypothetical protein
LWKPVGEPFSRRLKNSMTCVKCSADKAQKKLRGDALL